MKSLRLRLGPYEEFRGWLRSGAVAAFAGVFLTLSGAFGTGDAPLLVRAVYWLSLMALGAVWGAMVSRQVFSRARLGAGGVWLDVGLAALLMSAPLTLVVWIASRVLFGSDMPLSGLPILFGSVLLVSLAITAINVLLEGRHTSPGGGAPAPARFLERLPLRLRGAEVWAVEAEDHYLRLHTSKGQDLILMRLVDAVAELEGIEGMQVHRSWWVARDAITDAKRGDGRATLQLKDGSEVPVSRTYARMLRDEGWI